MLKYLLVFCLFLTACQSDVSQHSQRKHPTHQKTKKESDDNDIVEEVSFRAIQYKKLINKAQFGKIKNKEAMESFLLGKEFEQRNDFKKAGKLFQISFEYSKSMPSGISYAAVLTNLKNYQNALAVTQKLMLYFPQKEKPVLLYLNLLSLTNQEKKFKKALNKALLQFPKSTALIVAYAKVYPKEGLKKLYKYHRKHKRSLPIILQIGKIHFENEDYQKAITYFEKGMRTDPSAKSFQVYLGKSYDRLSNYKKSAAIYKKLVEDNPLNDTFLLAYVQSLLHLNQTQKAISNLEKAQHYSDENFPFPSKLKLVLGILYLQEKSYQKSDKLFLELQTHKEYSAEANYQLATISNLQKKYKSALAYLAASQESKYSKLEILKLKCVVYFNQGERTSSENVFQDFMTTPQHTAQDVYFMYQYFLANQKYSDALTMLKKLKKNKEDRNNFLYDIKHLELMILKNGINKNIPSLEILLKKWPRNKNVRNFVAYTLVQHGVHLNTAKKYLKQLGKSLNTNGYYMDSYGLYLMKSNQLHQAKIWFEKSLKLIPQEPIVLYHYGQLMEKLKWHVKSKKIMKKAQSSLEKLTPFDKALDLELLKMEQNLKKQGFI